MRGATRLGDCGPRRIENTGQAPAPDPPPLCEDAGDAAHDTDDDEEQQDLG